MSVLLRRGHLVKQSQQSNKTQENLVKLRKTVCITKKKSKKVLPPVSLETHTLSPLSLSPGSPYPPHLSRKPTPRSNPHGSCRGDGPLLLHISIPLQPKLVTPGGGDALFF